MITIGKIFVLMYLILVLATIGIASPLLNALGHRSKRACPYDYNYTPCSYGCCRKDNYGCGPSYYLCGANQCCYVACSRNYTACIGSGSNHCCPVTCPTGYIICHGASTIGTGSTYCCPNGNTCCAFTYNSANGGGGCCSSGTVAVAAAAQLSSCGGPKARCCPSTSYGSYCNTGSKCGTNGYCP